MSEVAVVSSLDPIAELGFPRVLGAWIAGRWYNPPGLDEIDIEDPATAGRLGTTIDADEQTVDSAVSAAHGALSSWRKTAPAERGRLLYRIAQQIRSEGDLLAKVECVDTGKPLSQARTDVESAARYFEYYAGIADKILGETLPQPSGTFVYTLREPYGVVAHITPWNSPLAQMTRGAAPSLAAGNTVVVKPSELTPFSSFLAAQIFERAGLPLGVCNVVPGRGPTAGAALVQHHFIRHITFTGSVPTGRTVMAMAANRIVPCNLELGGKSPTIVLRDADMTAASTAGAAAVVRNSGQSCFATTRLLVHRSIHDEFVERVVERVSGLSLGRGLDNPDLGPLVSAPQLAKVENYLKEAEQVGVTVHQAHVQVPTLGHFVVPAVLSGVHNDMRVAREEIFGPVQCILAFDEEDEAIAIANDSEFGLAAGIFTRNLSAAHRVAAQLEAGQVQINRYPAGGIDTPFGGYKQSGMGHEKGLEAVHHYTQLKTVIIAIDEATT